MWAQDFNEVWDLKTLLELPGIGKHPCGNNDRGAGLNQHVALPVSMLCTSEVLHTNTQ